MDEATTTCPFCKESVKADATVCPHCRKGLDLGSKVTRTGVGKMELGCSLMILIPFGLVLLIMIFALLGWL